MQMPKKLCVMWMLDVLGCAVTLSQGPGGEWRCKLSGAMNWVALELRLQQCTIEPILFLHRGVTCLIKQISSFQDSKMAFENTRKQNPK